MVYVLAAQTSDGLENLPRGQGLVRDARPVHKQWVSVCLLANILPNKS
jgi:hypothetical protein